MRFADSLALRYVLVGLLNTAVGYGLFALSYLSLRGHLTHATILVLAHVLAVSFGFFTHGRLVFKKGWPASWSAIAMAWARSQMSYVGILLLGLGINGLLIEGFGISAWIAQAVATVMAILAGWILNRRVIFKFRPEPSHHDE